MMDLNLGRSFRLARAGSATRVKYPGGETVEYMYDAAGNRCAVVRTSAPGDYDATIALTGPGPVNLRSIANANSYNGAQRATITFEVGSGVTISGAAGTVAFGVADGNPGGVAIDSGAWPTCYPTALTLRVKTGGKVFGGGGAGGAGAGAGADFAPGGTSVGGKGGLGGDAVYCQLAMNIQVDSGGEIKAGGGGGGGGGGWYLWNSDDLYWVGGRGGGGFPNGAGTGGAGAGTTSGGGAGGAGGFAPPGKTTGAGGAGGGAGASGLNGAVATGTAGSYTKLSNGSGRAAGYAIRRNGQQVVVTNNGTIAGTIG